MQDFRIYNYSFDTVNQLLKAIKDCKDFGSEPLIILNGEYYSLSKEFYNEIRKEIKNDNE